MLAAGCSSRVKHAWPATAALPGSIDVNRATVEEFERLPAIGRRTAESIVEHRTRHGDFRRQEHMMLVTGISEERFIEIQPYIRIE